MSAWDDLEMSLRAIVAGRPVLYIPFDVVNICTITDTFDQTKWRRAFAYNEALTRRRFQKVIDRRVSNAGNRKVAPMLCALVETDTGLAFEGETG